jgi:hypothetical protein
MIVTPTGQVSTAFDRVSTVYSLNRQRAMTRIPVPTARLSSDIRALTGSTIVPGASRVEVRTMSTEPDEGYRIASIAMKSDGGMELMGRVASSGSGLKSAVLMLDNQANSDFERLAKSGRIVMMLEPRPTPLGTESIKSPYLGPFNLLSLRAFLVGKTIIGLRIDDAIRAVDWLAAHRDVRPNEIAIYGSGPMGMVALHAAALDGRISKVVAVNTLASYRMIVDQPAHRNVSEVVIPGVLLHYDSSDLVAALAPRPVVYVSPRDALGDAMSESDFRAAIGKSTGIQFQAIAPGEPLPLN